MAKLTKMQINKVEETLIRIKDKKVSEFRSEQKKKYDKYNPRKDCKEDILKEPIKFINSLFNGINEHDNYRLKNIIFNFPPVAKKIEKGENHNKLLDDETCNYKEKLNEEINDIILKIHFDGLDEITDIINKFKSS